MAWTKMQEKAIYTRGSNIIVSAGAGSGKTAVLSERILDYCLKGNDIRNLLVLTFTNAAALEMRERIRRKLIDNKLLEQAGILDSAYITTFDAYSLALVKKYYFKLNLDKNVGIIDQSLLAYKKQQLLDDLFIEFYEEKNQDFFDLLSQYSKQNDDGVKKIILNLLDKIELIVDEKSFIRDYELNYYNSNFINNLVDSYEKLAINAFNEVKNLLKELLDAALNDDASASMACGIENILKSLDVSTYDELAIVINNLKLPNLNSKASDLVKELKGEVGELIKDLKVNYFSKYLCLEEARKQIIALKDNVLYILKIINILQERLYIYKYQAMRFDYSDIAKMAIRLVRENKDILEEVKKGFTEILIDEYQDTSDIQEAFISLISNNNVYMVGDIKQSIYRFRNANPYIFKEKYENYSNNLGGIKIDLNFNFRSRQEVIHNINSIFSILMTNDCGDADYSQNHKMHFGQTNYNNLNQDYNFNMDILSYSSDDNFDDEEIEAFICGRNILKLIETKVKCLKGNQFVPVTFNDIAILIDKTKTFITFKKVFEYLGIPLSIEADMDLNESILPRLISNILILISKTKEGNFDKIYYHALASIGRSFIFGYDDNTIYKLVNEKIENELTVLIQELIVKDESLIDLYYLILDKFNIYSKLELIGDIDNNLVILEYIHSLFETMHAEAMTLSEASDYLANVFESGIDLKYKLAKDSNNSVHIMTIHKSKGLEFPYCFFPMLASNFNLSDLKENFGLSNKYGIYLPYSDETNSDTIIKALVKEDIKKAEISEKVRLFYVALTRTKEKIILISNDKDYKDKALTSLGYTCFNGMLRSLRFLAEEFQRIDIKTLGLTKDYKINKPLKKIKSSETLKYENQDYTSKLEEHKHISKELKELTDSSLKRAIELGKLFHECLEVLDFNNPNIESLPVDDFTKKKLKTILDLPLFSNISLSKTYHEYEFYYKEYHGIIDLFCVYADHIDIIDYKLSNTTSEEYLRQLSIYKEYVESISDKPVSCYLLSILKCEVKKVL